MFNLALEIFFSSFIYRFEFYKLLLDLATPVDDFSTNPAFYENKKEKNVPNININSRTKLIFFSKLYCYFNS